MRRPATWTPASGADRRIRVVAGICAVLGTIAWAEAARAMVARQELILGMELLLLPAALGLVRQQERWRRATRILVAISAALTAIVWVAAIFWALPDSMSVFGREINLSSWAATLLVSIWSFGYLLILAWVFRLLGDRKARGGWHGV